MIRRKLEVNRRKEIRQVSTKYCKDNCRAERMKAGKKQNAERKGTLAKKKVKKYQGRMEERKKETRKDKNV